MVRPSIQQTTSKSVRDTAELDWGRLKAHELNFCAGLRATQAKQKSPCQARKSKTQPRPSSAQSSQKGLALRLGLSRSLAGLAARDPWVPQGAHVISARELSRINTLLQEPLRDSSTENKDADTAIQKTGFASVDDAIQSMRHSVASVDASLQGGATAKFDEYEKSIHKVASEIAEPEEQQPLFIRDPRCGDGCYAPLLRIPSRNRSTNARPVDSEMSRLLSSETPKLSNGRQNPQTQKTSNVVIPRCAGVPTPLNTKFVGIHSKEVASSRKQHCLQGDGLRGNFEAHLLDFEEEI